jgi:multiple sugar transport system substrate-binding protein
VEWSHFAVSNGFRFHDGPWSQAFYYDDPKLAETFRWYRDASLEKGWIIPAREARQIGGAGLFSAKKGALLLSGSWMIGTYSKMCDFEYGYAPLPVGPNGRKTMFNGLADSVAAGTEHPEEAWKWVKFLGSREGQMIIAEAGVVFPAVREAAVRATEVMTSRGVDVSIFLEQAMDEDATFPFPITEHGSDIISISRAAMDEVVLGSGNVDTVLSTLDRDVDSLFQQ